MAGTAVTVSALSSTTGFGSLTIGPFTVNGTITPIVLGPSLASGDNTITVPATSSGFVFSPPATNTFALKLKGAAADTGVSLPKATPCVYFFDTGALPASVIINAAGATGQSEIIFF